MSLDTTQKRYRPRGSMVPQDDSGIAGGGFKTKALLNDVEIAALYAGQRYENYRGRERLDNTLPQKSSVRSNITCTALVTSQGGGVI